MIIKIVAFLTALTAVHCLPSVTADCIGSFQELNALEQERGENGTTPVSYIICPNTVFDLDVEESTWELQSNTEYLCGENGSSANNCVVVGGFFQLSISFTSFGLPKNNTALSGFTFEKAQQFGSFLLATSGNHIIRDCIWKNNTADSVIQILFYIPPTLRRNRLLGSSSNEESDKFDVMNDLHNYLKDPKLQEQRQKDRSLLIGGGSEPRLTLLLDQVQFLNNSLTSVINEPSFASNSLVKVGTAFTDITISKSLFKDNEYPFSSTIQEEGTAVRVASSSTLTISDTCFVNNFFSFTGTVWITADSGLVASENNYVTASPSTSCQYIFKEEAFKCFAPESNVCHLPTCAASYKLFNARNDELVAMIENGGTYTSPPCNLNIEAILPCVTTGAKVTLQLLRNGRVIREREEVERFFLFGNSDTNIFGGALSSGTYTIQASVDGTILPSPVTFTLAGRCKRNN